MKGRILSRRLIKRLEAGLDKERGFYCLTKDDWEDYTNWLGDQKGIKESFMPVTYKALFVVRKDLL